MPWIAMSSSVRIKSALELSGVYSCGRIAAGCWLVAVEAAPTADDADDDGVKPGDAAADALVGSSGVRSCASIAPCDSRRSGLRVESGLERRVGEAQVRSWRRSRIPAIIHPHRKAHPDTIRNPSRVARGNRLQSWALEYVRSSRHSAVNFSRTAFSAGCGSLMHGRGPKAPSPVGRPLMAAQTAC